MKQALNFQILILAIIGCALILASCSDVDAPYLPPPELVTSSPSFNGDGSSSNDQSSNSSVSSSSSESKVSPQFDGDEFIDQRDGKKYKYEIYNGRVWMSENLNYSKGGTIGYCYKTGTEKYTLGTPGENLPGCGPPYGRAYTYEIATDGNPLGKAKGICPIGWHIPSSTEWTQVASNISKIFAGNYDPSPSKGYWKERTGDGDTYSIFGFYWFSNAEVTGGVGFVFMTTSEIDVRTTSQLAKLNDYFSVRCVMDEDFQPKCGNQPLSLADEYCIDGTKYPKMCGGKTWNPKLQQCTDGILTCLPNPPSGYYCFGDYVYQTITVGDKIWMTSNLDGGTTYNWAAAMVLEPTCNSNDCVTQIQTPNHQGICPTGWHIPIRNEITSNTFFNSGTWWTATQESGNESNYAYYKDSYGDVVYSYKNNLRPVRCVKN